MAKVRTIKNALNGGELSPLLYGRTEIPRYSASAMVYHNAIPMVGGGVTRRPGFRQVHYLISAICRMIPMVISDGMATKGYMLIIQNGKTYIAHNGALLESSPGVPVQLTTPYQTADLDALRYDQLDNELWLAHPDYPPAYITRSSDTSWSYTVPVMKGPWETYKAKTNTVTASATSGSVTLTAAAAAFAASDVGRVLAIGHKATAWAASTAVTEGVIRASKGNLYICTEAGTTGSDRLDGTDDGILDGTAVWDYYLPGNINYGVAQITAYTDNKHVTATVLTTLQATTASKYWSWSKWSSIDGYPAGIAFSEQRLLFGGTDSQPTTLWGSKNGDRLMFRTGTAAVDPFEFRCAGASTRIQQLAVANGIIILTGNRELTATGGDGESSITPTSVDIKVRTNYGSHPNARPVPVGGEVLLASQTGKQLRAFGYRFDVDRYSAPDVALIADHLLTEGDGIKQMAYMRDPWPCVWIVTENGRLLSLVYDKEQGAMAWSRHHSDIDNPLYLDVAVIPDASGQDQLWVVVQRDYAHARPTFVEYLDASLSMDCAITQANGPASTLFDLTALFGFETLQFKADGVVYEQAAVRQGDDTAEFPAPVTLAEAGLQYTMTVQTLPLEMGQPNGTIQGAATRVHKTRLLLHEAQQCSVDGTALPLAAATSGWRDVTALGWTRDGHTLTITAGQPLPCTVLALVYEVTVND